MPSPRSHEALPRPRLLLVGDGPEAGNLRGQWPDAVCRHARRALATHYASADLFLFPSLTETFGNVTLEAMAERGLPVVAFGSPPPASTSSTATTACSPASATTANSPAPPVR